MAATAIATLTAAFEETFTNPDTSVERDGNVILSWPSIPIEIIRAVGLVPMFARGQSTPTLEANAHLESGIFPSRLRHLVNAALTGRLSNAACIVIPRTSDPDYKCFLYLRELVRLGIIEALPPTLLFNLLQSQAPEAQDYNAARTRALFEDLALVAGRKASLDDLRCEIQKTNAARAAARRLIAQRRGAPRVTGTEVLPLLGAFWRVEPEHYAALATEAAREIERRPSSAGPRVLLAGAPVDGPALHAGIESRGAIVVAETGPWGSGAAGDDIDCGGDPIAALSEKYCNAAIGPRTPAIAIRNAIARNLDDVDAVVLSLPPEDTVFGWDYPALRSLFEAKHIPHVCLGGEPNEPLSDSDSTRLDALMAAAETGMEARHG